VSVLPKFIYTFNAIAFKFPVGFILKHVQVKLRFIWKNKFIVRPVCPCSGEKMTYEAPKRIGLWRINIEAKCEKDGDFMIVLRMSETPEKTFSVNQQIFILDENMRLYFEGKQTKRHRRRPSGRGKVHNKPKTEEIKEVEENA